LLWQIRVCNCAIVWEWHRMHVASIGPSSWQPNLRSLHWDVVLHNGRGLSDEQSNLTNHRIPME
jgi:hypothetical protein